MIIALVNSKGGVGKSTIAGNLAAWLSEKGFRVALADCDAQKSSSQWVAEAAPKVFSWAFSTPDEVIDELPALGKEFDYVIADGPGSQTETSRALLMRADLAVVPCKASMFESRALAINTSFVRQAQDIRNGAPRAIAVLSMVGREHRLTRDMSEAAKSLNLSLAKTPMTLRQAHADAPGQATFVWRMGYQARDAAEELENLFNELIPEAAASNVLSLEKGRGRKRVNARTSD